jgi:hypothetical protein
MVNIFEAIIELTLLISINVNDEEARMWEGFE